MNLHQLTEEEASYLLFAIKKALRDRPGLTPRMEQFFDNTYDALSQKLQRISGSRPGIIAPPIRNRYAKVRPSWLDITLNRKPDDSSEDSGPTGPD